METIEASNKQDIKKIITATKYLKKIIKRLPKESITEHDKSGYLFNTKN
jgi:membrane-bound lytic murein transglycosylase MltF